ncbi:death domain-containing protein [Caerostris darwini]|uniref:Death domain-containing protein n=1 Tax=Caerostris darwini TaxID=1538125 RepID=A0AAV4STM3_9ARAC|nr:death domain-containing protein [Caerostris darwini]
MDQCRKLSESLHENGFELHGKPKGDEEPKHVSCFRLLEHWNTHEGKGQTFHQLALRLKQLGHQDVADRLSKSVSSEKVGEVRELFLKDPFKSKINTNSPLLQESPHVEPPALKKAPDTSWTASEVMQVVVFVMVAFVVLILATLTIIRIFLPDSFVRMRASLYQTFTGRRPEEDKVFFIM